MGMDCIKTKKKRSEAVADYLKGDGIEVLEVAPVGNVYYAAYRKDGVTSAVVVLTGRSKGYLNLKPIREQEGPFYHDCPASILDRLDPTDHKWAQSWREKCRANLDKENRRADRAELDD